MWHKPCRTFHPWCPCIKTRCLSCDDASIHLQNGENECTSNPRYMLWIALKSYNSHRLWFISYMYIYIVFFFICDCLRKYECCHKHLTRVILETVYFDERPMCVRGFYEAFWLTVHVNNSDSSSWWISIQGHGNNILIRNDWGCCALKTTQKEESITKERNWIMQSLCNSKIQ